MTETLRRPDGGSIAYSLLPGRLPGVVFLHGLSSDMGSRKALVVEDLCRRQGRFFLRYDASAHGASSGAWLEMTISRWVEDALLVLDRLAPGPQLLVGSSLGGWIALLVALRRPERVAGLVLTSVAADFTEDVIWAALPEEKRRALMAEGKVDLPGWGPDAPPYPVGRPLIEDGRAHLLLRGPIQVSCPVRMIHGQMDPDNPWSTSLKVMECLIGQDVETVLVKSGDDRLWTEADLRRLERVVEGVLIDLERAGR